MEWRPQKEGIATFPINQACHCKSSMEWRPQKEGIATLSYKEYALSHDKNDGMETSKRRDCDSTLQRFPSHPKTDGMETSKRRDCDHALIHVQRLRSLRWNGDLKKKGLRRFIFWSHKIVGWNGDLKKKGLRPPQIPIVKIRFW
jgi:hypothetical protein